MIKKRKILYIVLAVVLAVGGFGLTQALAVTPGLYEVEGNPDCANLYEATVISGPDSDLLDLGPLFGLKYNTNPTGDVTHTFTDDSPWEVTSGPQDPNNWIKIFNVILSEGGEGVQFDWAASLGLDAVIVKAQDANAYVYSPEAFGSSGLMAPDGKGISHIEFCYDYELTATKTANAEYTRTYTWTIDKSVSPAVHTGFAGDTFTSDYDIIVDRIEADSDFKVTGEININNPTPFEVGFSVNDFVGTYEATVTCPDDDYTLDANETKICTYVAELGDTLPANGTNTATITSLNEYVDGATATANYAFGDPTELVGYPTVNVTDTFPYPGGTLEALGSANGDFTFDNDQTFECSADPGAYTDGYYSYTKVNQAEITQTGQHDEETVTVNCYLWDVSKTADGSYNDQYRWDITKEVIPPSQSGFAGDTLSWTWSITWESFFVEEINHAVTGVITVTNPAPMPLTVDVTDYLTGSIAAMVDCDAETEGSQTSLTVAAESLGTCSYTAAPESLLTENTATAARKGISVSDTVNVNWVKGPDVGLDAVINDSNNISISTNSTQPFTYSESYTCSTSPETYDATTGKYSGSASNTATITWTGGSDEDTANTSYDCYIPSISKTAAGTYDERHDWEVTKTVDPLSQSGFIGDTVNFNWTITVDETIYEENFVVTGTITVVNPNLEDVLVVTLTDELSDLKPGVIDQNSCAFDGTYLTVAAGGSETCDYAVNDLADYTDDADAPKLNTATITLNHIAFDATAQIEYTAKVINGSATLDDEQYPYDGQVVTDDWTDTYQDSYTCLTDLALYVDYGGTSYQAKIENTATLYDGEEMLDADHAYTLVDCYIPTITKDASGTYDERHEWDVEKTVDPLLQSGYPGDVLGWTWTITVYEDVFEENFDVTGAITVVNPNLEDTLVVSLVDFVNGNAATITGCTGGTYLAGKLTVLAGGTAICDYAANDLPYTALTAAPTLNTATITLNGITFDATDPIEYTANVIRGTAKLSDTEIGLLDEAVADGDKFTGKDEITCSTNRSAYGENGSYGDTITNWANLTDSEGNQYSDEATTVWLCEASFVDIYKTTNGAPADPSMDITFALYAGTTQLETVSTLNNGADLEFMTALVPGDEYTICEYPVPAGYTFEISVDGGNVLTYAGPPGESNPTGEIQCFDFTAKPAGTTVTFNIENRYPGGAPRTPGYWKNWSTCSGGKQAETAEKLGGVAEGIYLLDDLLPQTLGSFTVGTCEVGVSILSAYDVESGKNKNNDAAYTLAKALLAARLNQDAGACVPTDTFDGLTFEQILTEADALLAGIGFDGTGDYLGPKNKKEKALAAYALNLAGIIDDYNNSELCTGEPSH